MILWTKLNKKNVFTDLYSCCSSCYELSVMKGKCIVLVTKPGYNNPYDDIYHIKRLYSDQQTTFAKYQKNGFALREIKKIHSVTMTGMDFLCVVIMQRK